MKTKAIFTTMQGERGILRVYSQESRAFLENELEFKKPFYSMDDLETDCGEWNDVEYMFSTWGPPRLSEDQLEKFFPKLKAIFYGAGSVQHFARPFLNKGVRVISANEAISYGVVDFTAAQIFLANKGYFQASRIYKNGSHEQARKYVSNVPGNEGTAAGIIGAGRIGKGVIARLRAGRVKINVFDPFLSPQDSLKLGVNKLETLEELFSSSFVVSNHLANNEQTKGMIRYRHFTLLHDYGVFINTGRGAQVDEEGLVRALKEKPTKTALLDVSWPEPVQPGHAFFEMDNVYLSPHIAGTINNECIWQGEYIVEEYNSFKNGEPLRGEVTEEMLLTMA